MGGGVREMVVVVVGKGAGGVELPTVELVNKSSGWS
jgi:hypothetical protein